MRVSEIVAAALLYGRLALAGMMSLAIAGLLGDGPTAQAQESDGERERDGEGILALGGVR